MLRKYNVYYTLNGIVEVDAPNAVEAKYKIILNQNMLTAKDRRISVVEVMEINFDDFFRCPSCKSQIQYLDYSKHEVYYLNDKGKRKSNYIVLQEEIEKDLDGHLNCTNNKCNYLMPYDWVFDKH